MENEKTSQTFDGFNIEALEEGLGLKLGQSDDTSGQGSGEPGPGKGDDGQEKNEKAGVKMPADNGNFIQIPETEAEAKEVYGEEFLKDGETVDDKKADTAGKEQIGDGESPDDTKKPEEGDGDQKGNKSQDEGGAKVTEDSPLYLHAATLQETGILPNLDLDKIKDLQHDDAVKYIIDAQKELIVQGKDEYKNSLSEDQRNYLDMVEKGVPDNEARDMASIEKAYRGITDEILSNDEDLQKQVIYNANELKGLKPEKIKIIIDKAEEDGSLYEEAKDSKADIDSYLNVEKLKKIQLAEEEQTKRQEKEEELQKKIQSSVESVDEILPGIKITEGEKKAILEYMTKPVDTVVRNGRQYPVNYINQKRNDDRVDFDIKLNYFIKLGLFDKNADLSKLTKRNQSSSVEKLSKKLRGDDTSENISVKERNKKGVAGADKGKIMFPKGINNF